MVKPMEVETEEPGDEFDDDNDNLIRAQQNCHAPMSKWERRLVVVSLVVHVADVCLDMWVVVLFFNIGCTSFAMGSALVVFWACAASSLYMSCGAGVERMGHESSNGLDSPRESRRQQILAFLGNLSQAQIFTEAYRCWFQMHDGDFFHTLRLMEGILEAAPNSLVQLYALAYWPMVGALSEPGANLLRISIFVSFLSVGLSFAMFEQKVQTHASPGYIASVAVMRMFEIASRSLTLALVSALTHPYGFWWALILDYFLMVAMTMRHKSVRSSYSFFLSAPLVLMSYEPVVWRREDHVVPKDQYFVVRIFEFVVMWIIILTQQEIVPMGTPLFAVVNNSPLWSNISTCSFGSTLALFLMLPCIYRVARRHELPRDGMENEEFDQLEQGVFDSDSDSGDGDYGSEEDEDEHQQHGLLSGEATNKDFSNEQE